jgi:signal transduction histidine kinase
MRLFFAGVLIAAAMLAPLFAFGSLVRETVERDIVARSAEERSLAARIAAASIERELRSVGDTLVFFGSGPTLRAALADRDAGVLDRRLGDLLQGRRNSLGAILDARGVVLAAPLAPDLVGQDFSHRDYFKGALATAGPYVSEIFVSASPGAPSVVAVSYAIQSGSTPLGIVVLTLLPADLLELLRPLRQVEGRDLLLVDPEDRTVAATDPRFRPLERVALPAAPASTEPVTIGDRPRIATPSEIGMARWTLYVLDDPSIVLMGERRLLDQLRGGAAAIGLIALVAAGAVVLLYAKTVRQRDALARSEGLLERANDELERRLDQLDAANRELDAFAYSVSHDLRAPLRSLDGFSAALLKGYEGVLDETGRRYLNFIRGSSQEMAQLIDDLLRLSLVTRSELRQEDVDLSDLAREVVDQLRASEPDRRARVEIEPGLRAIGDRALLRAALENLMGNAWKFTAKRGEAEISFGMVPGADRDTFYVRDNGAGFDMRFANKLFGTFQRLHSKEEFPGTGIGLATVQRIVRRHGGDVWATGAVDAGATFSFSLARRPKGVSDTAEPSRTTEVAA